MGGWSLNIKLCFYFCWQYVEPLKVYSLLQFILCFGDISWQAWRRRMKCWQGCASPFHSWRKKVSFYTRWRDSNLIRFTANWTPWASFFSSVLGDGQTDHWFPNRDTETETCGPHFDLTHKPNLWALVTLVCCFSGATLYRSPWVHSRLPSPACLHYCSLQLLWAGIRPMSFMWFRHTKRWITIFIFLPSIIEFFYP